MDILHDDTMFLALAKASSDLVCITTEGLITFVNPAGAAILGAESPDSLINVPFISFIHPDFLIHDNDVMELLAAEQMPTPLMLRTRHGQNFQVEFLINYNYWGGGAQESNDRRPRRQHGIHEFEYRVGVRH